MSDSMVERVAKAFHTFSVGGYDNDWNICRRDTATGGFVEVVEVRSGSYADACIYCNEMNARAAIAAMRTPTPRMMEIAESDSDFVLPYSVGGNSPEARRQELTQAWMKAIDVALYPPVGRRPQE